MDRAAIMDLQRELSAMNTGMVDAENELREIKRRVRSHARASPGAHKTLRHRNEMGATLAHAEHPPAKLQPPRRVRAAVGGDEPPAGFKEKPKPDAPTTHARERPEERTQDRIFPDEQSPPLKKDPFLHIPPRGGAAHAEKARAAAIAGRTARRAATAVKTGAAS